MNYTAPNVTPLGSVRELTLAGLGNKNGANPDIYSNVVPIVGSIGPVVP
jgi:hypothetical protein